jgi:putative ABC transport system substrate-binding protein
LIAGLSAALAPSAVWPLVALAQQPDRIRHIGVLMNVVQEDPSGSAELMAFRQGLAELGWIEGRNIFIEFRWPGSDIELAQTFAKELVGLRPDVLIGRSSPTTADRLPAPGSTPASALPKSISSSSGTWCRRSRSVNTDKPM